MEHRRTANLDVKIVPCADGSITFSFSKVEAPTPEQAPWARPPYSDGSPAEPHSGAALTTPSPHLEAEDEPASAESTPDHSHHAAEVEDVSHESPNTAVAQQLSHAASNGHRDREPRASVSDLHVQQKSKPLGINNSDALPRNGWHAGSATGPTPASRPGHHPHEPLDPGRPITDLGVNAASADCMTLLGMFSDLSKDGHLERALHVVEAALHTQRMDVLSRHALA